jgi:hypothetical protein
MGNQKLLQLQNKNVVLPRLDFQKVKQHSGLLKTLMLLIPLLILMLLGALISRWRIRRFSQ